MGQRMHPVTISQLHDFMVSAITHNKQRIIGHHNAHSLYLLRRNPDMQLFYHKADLVYVDSMPLIALARLSGYKLSRDCRITLVDHFLSTMKLAASKHWRVFYLGGKPGVAERAFQSLQVHAPNVQVATHHGYFDHQPESKDTMQVIQAIHDFKPDLLWVGMGMPVQETWLHHHAHHLQVPVIWACGATADYFAGEQPMAPRWMGRAGLEWLHRLATQPRRLGKRYLIEPWFLLPAAIRDVWQQRGRRS